MKIDPILVKGSYYHLAFGGQRVSVELLVEPDGNQFRCVQARKTFWYRNLQSQVSYVQFRTDADIWCEFELIRRETNLHKAIYRLNAIRKVARAETLQAHEQFSTTFIFEKGEKKLTVCRQF